MAIANDSRIIPVTLPGDQCESAVSTLCTAGFPDVALLAISMYVHTTRNSDGITLTMEKYRPMRWPIERAASTGVSAAIS